MINVCILIRYDSSKGQQIDINPYEHKDIGIELYSLNFLRNAEDLNLSYVKKKMKNKEYTHYAIVFTEKIQLDSFNDTLKLMFNEFWERRVLNVIIVFWTNKLNCFTYSPFEKQFLIPLSTNETKPESVFYDKTINLNGHQLKVGMFNEEQRAKITYVDKKPIMRGMDGGFAGMVIKRMNATLVLIEPLDGELYPNKTINGIFALLANETVDMSFNARFFRMQQFRQSIEPTISIGRDDLCILVPRAGISLNLDNIFDTFEWPVWALIVVSLPIYALLFHLHYNDNKRRGEAHTFTHAFLRLFGWNLNQPYMRSPAKIMLGLWIIYSAVITNWYNSSLTSYLMVKPRLPDIKTLEQLEQSNYHILTLQKYGDLIEEFIINSKEHQNLLGRIDTVDHSFEIFKRVVFEKDTSYAYAHKEHIIRYLVSKGRLYDTFAQMTECPVPFLNTYALAYGSPYKGRINYIISQSQDCGIFDHWLDIKSHIDKLIQARHQKSTSEHHVAISIFHLQTAFYILFFGCTVSFLVFLFEIKSTK